MVNQTEIDKAVQVLREGGLVGMPTETVYGLAADASSPDSLRKIFAAKGRPEDHPLIVHVGAVNELSKWARDISEDALKLAHAMWPGPLTLILKKAPHVSDLVTGKQDTVGLRIPGHPVALALLKAFGGGLAAPSANRFGRISPTTADAVREELGGTVSLVLEGGQCDVGVESTIVDMSGEHPVILRPGMISATQIEEVLNKSLSVAEQQGSPRVSGSLESHYAPLTKTRLIESQNIINFLEKVSANELPVVVLTYSVPQQDFERVKWILMPSDAKGYAHDLYHVLRQVDKEHFSQILIEEVPLSSDWGAVRDRLQRASS